MRTLLQERSSETINYSRDCLFACLCFGGLFLLQEVSLQTEKGQYSQILPKASDMAGSGDKLVKLMEEAANELEWGKGQLGAWKPGNLGSSSGSAL